MPQFTSKAGKRNYYERQANLAEFLTWYHQQELPEYEEPSLTVDMVLLCYNREADRLKILLIQREGHPFRNSQALPGGFVNRSESTEDNILREIKEETGVVISQENIERLHSFSRPNRDPRGWVVTVNYLAFIGEEPLIAGGNAEEAHWFNLERHGQHITLSHEDVEITLDLKTAASLGEDTLAFNHSEVIIKAFNCVVGKMGHEPQVLQVLGKDFTITEARKVFAKFLGVDYRSIDRSNFKKTMTQYFKGLDGRPVDTNYPSKIYQLKITAGF